MSKELMTVNQGLDFNNPEIIKVLKQTVAKGTTDAEFAMFTAMCGSSGLNPFQKEIWCIVAPEKTWTDYKTGQTKKKDRQVQMMGGINGFYAIANDQPQFDGLEKGYIGKNGEYLPSTYPKDDFIGAWTKVYRKDRKFPQEETAFLSEYAKDFGNWKTMKRIMIQKCSDALALRKSFPQKLNGLYIPEEMPQGYDQPKDDGGNSGAPAVIIADALPQPEKQRDHPLDAVSMRQWEPHKDKWDGESEITFGKHKGKKWKDLSAEYIEWVYQNAKTDFSVPAGFEIHRREEAEQAKFEEINEQAAAAKDDFDADELPTFNNKGE